MSYVYEYDIVAIVFTFIIIITFLRNKTIETSITKIFTILITDVIIADIFDLLTNYTINNSDKIPIWLNALLLMIFYITYNSFVPLICLFLLIQTGTPLKIKNKKLPIKTLLLDQSIIVGLGNIYVDEVLFLSKLKPTRKPSTLKNSDLENIIINTKDVLEHAIMLGGTTIRTYESSEGVHGLFQNELLIHGKDKCPICSSTVKKIRVGGRGTYYCEVCQK